jgi:hypothetical protein
MKTNIHFWSHLAQFFIKWKMIQAKVVEKTKTHILWSVPFFFFEIRVVYEIMLKNIVKRGRPQLTKWSMRSAWWIPRATNIHSGRVIAYLLLFLYNNGCTNAPQCYVTRTLPVLLISYWKTKILDRKAATMHQRLAGIKCIAGLVNQTGREFCRPSANHYTWFTRWEVVQVE